MEHRIIERTLRVNWRVERAHSVGDPDEQGHPDVNRIFFFAYGYTRRLAARTVSRRSQDFLTLWKDADPDIPIYQQAKAEYAKLQ